MEPKKWDILWINTDIETCDKEIGFLKKGALAVKDDKIDFVGTMDQLPSDFKKSAKEITTHQGCLTPGLIDCHTHLVYAGNRANEFEMRLNGVSYADIAKNGGGIQSTVQKTRACSEEDLFLQSCARAKVLQSQGVTTLEIKSGYGLDLENEIKMLRVANRIQYETSMSVKKTFLGAHAVAKEYQGNAQGYVDHVCNTMIPKIAEENLADAIDVFCEHIAFDLKQTEQIFQAAKKYHIPVKCHADQLSSMGAVPLAVKYQALSVDHLEHLSDHDIKFLCESQTVAVLLPGAFYFLRETKLPPVESLRKYKIPMAIATDCNPGTSPILSPLMILNMACTLFRLTPMEALMGMTLFGAQALGIDKSHGSLTVGKQADIAVWDVNHPNEICYYLGNNSLSLLIKNGKRVIL